MRRLRAGTGYEIDSDYESISSISRNSEEDNSTVAMQRISNMVQKTKNSMTTTFNDLKKLNFCSKKQGLRKIYLEIQETDAERKLVETDVDLIAFEIRNKVLSEKMRTSKNHVSWKTEYLHLLHPPDIDEQEPKRHFSALPLKNRIKYLVREKKKNDIGIRDKELLAVRYGRWDMLDRFQAAVSLKMIEIHEDGYETKSQLRDKYLDSDFFKLRKARRRGRRGRSFNKKSWGSFSRVLGSNDDFIVIEEANTSKKSLGRDNRTLELSESNLSFHDPGIYKSHSSIPNHKDMSLLRKDGKSIDLINF